MVPFKANITILCSTISVRLTSFEEMHPGLIKTLLCKTKRKQHTQYRWMDGGVSLVVRCT